VRAAVRLRYSDTIQVLCGGSPGRSPVGRGRLLFVAVLPVWAGLVFPLAGVRQRAPAVVAGHARGLLPRCVLAGAGRDRGAAGSGTVAVSLSARSEERGVGEVRGSGG